MAHARSSAAATKVASSNRMGIPQENADHARESVLLRERSTENSAFLGTWDQDEEERVVDLHRKLGACWAKISLSIPGRSADDIERLWRLKLRWRSLSPGERLALVIGRKWRLCAKRRMRLTLARAPMIERLLLESKLQTGLWRLVLFCTLFTLLVTVTKFGTPDSERNAVGALLENALDLPRFRDLNRLEDVRDFLPDFSSAIKRFSASSSARYNDANAYQLLSSAVSFTEAVPLVTLDLPVATRPFTMTAWIHDEGLEDGTFQPILRKPLSTNPSHSCWGWYYPAAFMFGAHDFHSVTMMQDELWQETALEVTSESVTFFRGGQMLEMPIKLPRVVTDCVGTIEMGGADLQISALKFYPRALEPHEIREIFTNGQPLSEVATGSGLQTLDEDPLVTVDSTIDTAGVIKEQTLESTAAHMIQFAGLRESSADRENFLYDYLPDPSPCASLWQEEEQLFLPPRELARWQACSNKSPHAFNNFSMARTGTWRREITPSHCRVSQDFPFFCSYSRQYPVAQQCALVRGCTKWSKGQAPRCPNGNTACCCRRGGCDADNGEWCCGIVPDAGAYFSVIEKPVYALAKSLSWSWARNWPYAGIKGFFDDFFDYLGPDFETKATLGAFPKLPEKCGSFTITFWIKPIVPDKPFSARLFIVGDGEVQLPYFGDRSLALHLFSFGDAPAEFFHLGGWRYFRQDTPNFRTKFPEQGPLDDSFFLTSSTNPKPSPWRFIAWQVDFQSKTAKTFWDGRLASTVHLKESLYMPEFESVAEKPNSFPDVSPAMFSGASFYLDTTFASYNTLKQMWGDKVGTEKNLIKSKIAQLRVYPTSLSEEQLLYIQASSSWSEANQDPTQVNTLTERLPKQTSTTPKLTTTTPMPTSTTGGGATFEQATKACEAMNKSLVTASTPKDINDLLERAVERGGTVVQNLIWVGAENVGNRWRWREAPDSCVLSEREFYPGDFTCHESAEGVSLLEAQGLCQAEGRTLKIPQNLHHATLKRISMSCPGFTGGCRICAGGTQEQEIIQYACVNETSETPDGEEYGEEYIYAPQLNWGSNEAVCVLQGLTWLPVTAKDVLHYADTTTTPGVTCDAISRIFPTTSPCSGITDMKRVAGARDVDFGCGAASEPKNWSFFTYDDPDNLVKGGNLLYSCCTSQCSASEGKRKYHAFFCEGLSSYNADNTNKCLAVFKFEKELQYIALNCTQEISYVCQNPAEQNLCDPKKCSAKVGDMKECYDESDVESNHFMDTLEVDVQGHSCLWYAQMKTTYPQVCASSNARRMCPVTCQAKQICFSRKKKQATTEQQDFDAPPLPKDDANCLDMPNFLDSEGDSCAKWAANPTWCSGSPEDGVIDMPIDYKNLFGVDPAMACCVCGGGADRSVYKIFDRVMHLRPALPTIICPRSSINKDILVQECKQCQGTNTSVCQHQEYTDLPAWHFALMYNASWSGYNRANILDCDELAARVDSAQCAWNDSWVQPFTDEFKKTKAFSLSFWSKPVSRSRGMPGEFVSSVNFFSKLVTPKTFFDLQQAHPYEEAITRVDMANVVAEGWRIQGEPELYINTTFNFKVKPRISVELNHGGAVPFNSEWTFYHVSLKQNLVERWQHVVLPSRYGPTPRFVGVETNKVMEQWTLCLALNAMPRSCREFRFEYYERVEETNLDKHPDFRNGVGVYHPFPELYTSFIDAFEVTAEVLMSPIEVRPNLLSAYQVQEIYNAKAQRMKSITGPWLSERDRIDTLNVPVAKPVESFPERFLLASPPLIFQERTEDRACNLSAMKIFLEQQLALVTASHCRVTGECPGTKSRSDIYKCESDTLSTKRHFGLNTTTFKEVKGFADFLFTMADNEFIVRDQVLHPVREFLDMETKSARVLCFFYSPSNGDATVLTLNIDVIGSRITTKVYTEYFGLIASVQYQKVAACYGSIFAVCVIILLLNLCNFLESRGFVKKYGLETNSTVVIHSAELVMLRSAKQFSVRTAERRELQEAIRVHHKARTQSLDIQSESERYYRRDIYFDVFHVLLVLAFCSWSYVAALLSESRAETLANIVADVPWANPNVTVTTKITKFFGAMNVLESNLLEERVRLYTGFAILAMLTYRILMASAIHPRLAIVMSTVGNGADGFCHFAIIFFVVFFLFSAMSTWSFAAHYDAFNGMQASMATQFRLFIFDIPDVVIDSFQHPDENFGLVVFCVVTIVIQSFMMFNFLIAIVLEAFIEAQAEHKSSDIDLNVFGDILITLPSYIRGLFEGWPTKRKFCYMLMNEIATNNVAWWQMTQFGIPPRKARSLFKTYYGKIDAKTEMPVHSDGWQSQLRPQAQKSNQWSIACDLAHDLGLAGIPTPQVWAQVEESVAQALSNVLLKSNAEICRCLESMLKTRLNDIESMVEKLQDQAAMPNCCHPPCFVEGSSTAPSNVDLVMLKPSIWPTNVRGSERFESSETFATLLRHENMRQEQVDEECLGEPDLKIGIGHVDLDRDLGEGLARQAGASMPTRSRTAAADAMRRRANDQSCGSTYAQQEWISAEQKIKGQLIMERIREAKFSGLCEHLKDQQQEDKVYNSSRRISSTIQKVYNPALSAAMPDQGQLSPEDISAADFGKRSDAADARTTSLRPSFRLTLARLDAELQARTSVSEARTAVSSPPHIIE